MIRTKFFTALMFTTAISTAAFSAVPILSMDPSDAKINLTKFFDDTAADTTTLTQEEAIKAARDQIVEYTAELEIEKAETTRSAIAVISKISAYMSKDISGIKTAPDAIAYADNFVDIAINAADDAEKTEKALKAELATSTKAISDLQAELDAAAKLVVTLTSERDTAEKSVVTLTSERDDAILKASTATTLAKQVEDLQRELDLLKALTTKQATALSSLPTTSGTPTTVDPSLLATTVDVPQRLISSDEIEVVLDSEQVEFLRSTVLETTHPMKKKAIREENRFQIAARFSEETIKSLLKI